MGATKNFMAVLWQMKTEVNLQDSTEIDVREMETKLGNHQLGDLKHTEMTKWM